MLSCRMRGLAAAMVGVAVAVAACSSASPAPSGKVLRIGVDLPLSGPEARAATPALNGIRFYVQTHPAIDGFQVVVDARDDTVHAAADPERGVSNVNRFVSDSTVVAMIGPFDGAVARKEIPVANAAGLAMVAPATSNPCLTRDIYLPALLNPARADVTCQAAGLPSASDLRPTRGNSESMISSAPAAPQTSSVRPLAAKMPSAPWPLASAITQRTKSEVPTISDIVLAPQCIGAPSSSSSPAAPNVPMPPYCFMVL